MSVLFHQTFSLKIHRGLRWLDRKMADQLHVGLSSLYPRNGQLTEWTSRVTPEADAEKNRLPRPRCAIAPVSGAPRHREEGEGLALARRA